jgi:YegS/Rv2252/BmrU family lipid kinase
VSENKIFFIINTRSGAGYTATTEGRIIQESARHGYECELQFTRRQGHATELARLAAAAGYTKIVAVGGDGTVNESAQGVLGTTAALGILPKGSGNGLARHLGVSMSFGRALQQLFSAQPVSMDVLEINGRPSVNVSGIGFDGHVAALFGKNGRRGFWSYFHITVREFFRFAPFSFTMTPPHCAQNRPAFILAIANASQFGNNARIAPNASVRDGLADVVAIGPLNGWQALRLLWAGWIKKPAADVAPAGRIAHAVISTARPVPYHVDGEPQQPASHFTVRVLAGALCVLAPVGSTKI